MEQEQFDMILNIWQKEKVEEIDFVPVFDSDTVLFEQATIGISVKTVKSIYMFTYQRLMDEISEFRATSSPEMLARLYCTTTVLLSLKGDLPIAYVYRKLHVSNHKDLIGKEIAFLSAVFSKHPKSPSAWEHRRWCLQLHMKLKNRLNSMLAMEIETERELCRKSADKYPKNYYAWMHRLWLLQFMNISQLEQELDFVWQWLKSHISDHSAVNHYIQVLTRLLKLPELGEGKNELLRKSFETSKNSIVDFPGSEALWSLRRQLILLFASVIPINEVKCRQSLLDSFKSVCNDLRGNDSSHQPTEPLQSSVIEVVLTEIIWATQIAFEENKWDSKKQEVFALRYVLFIGNRFSKMLRDAELSEALYSMMKIALEELSKIGYPMNQSMIAIPCEC